MSSSTAIERSSQRMSKKIEDVKKNHPSLFAQVVTDEEGEVIYEVFLEALKVVCDVNDEKIMYHVSNRDLTWRPEHDENSNKNYFQYLLEDTDEREPVPSMLSYLFEDEEEYYNDHYELNEEEQKLRENFYNYLREHYSSSQEYIDRMCILLSSNSSNWTKWINLIQNKVFAPKILADKLSV
jgi:hypothetical protein